MSGNNLIDQLSPLITDELPLPLQPGFASLVSDTLGSAADQTDGFDSVLADLVAIVDNLEAGLIALGGADGGDLDDAFLEISELDSASPGADIANLSAALPDVQANVDHLGNLLTGAALPVPPTPGAGGIQVQPATSPILPFDARQGFGPGACGSYPCVALVPFRNPGPSDQTIDSIVLVQQAGGPWTVTTDAQPHFPPGTQYNLKIVSQVQPAASAVAQIQLHLRGIAVPAVFQLDAGIGSGGGGGGGGAGGSLKITPSA